jgi:hypothetical protein
VEIGRIFGIHHDVFPVPKPPLILQQIFISSTLERSFASLANSTSLPINTQVHTLVERTMCMYRKRKPNPKVPVPPWGDSPCKRISRRPSDCIARKANDDVADEDFYNMYWVKTHKEPTKEKKERPCAKVSLCVYVQTCPPWNPTLIFIIKIPPPGSARSAPGSSPTCE